MKEYRIIGIFLFILVCGCAKQPIRESSYLTKTEAKPGFPYAVIEKYMAKHERDERILTFDNFQRSHRIPSPLPPEIEILLAPVSIEIINDTLCKIKNKYSNGLTGISIEFLLNRDLKILDIQVHEQTDAFHAGALDETISVKNAILTLNSDPFEGIDNLRGRYSLLLWNDYYPGPHIQGDTMDSYHSVLNAKFKLYSKAEIEKGIDEIIREYDFSVDNLEQDGTYKYVDVSPAFPGGDKAKEDFLIKTLSKPKTRNKDCTSGNVLIKLTIDPDGRIVNSKIEDSKCEAYELEALRVVGLMPDWLPGIYRNKRVKAQVYLNISFE